MMTFHSQAKGPSGDSKLKQENEQLKKELERAQRELQNGSSQLSQVQISDFVKVHLPEKALTVVCTAWIA